MTTTTTTQVSEHDVLDAMETYGGGFVKALAQAWRRADETNGRKLRGTFWEYYEQYRQMAENDVNRRHATH